MNRTTLGLAMLLVVAADSSGQLPSAKLKTIFPPGAKAGSTVEVAVTGDYLDYPRQIFFSHPGITGKLHADGKRFVVSVAGDVPEGIHSVWVAGHYGASTPRGFHVGTAKEVSEAAGNHSFEKAQAVALGTTVNGRADKEANDFYRVSLKKGQVLSARCLDRDLDSRLQGTVVIYDAARREVARGRQHRGASYRSTVDGDVFVKVHDSVYRGGGEYFYRLLMSDGVPVDHVLPLAIKAGSRQKVRLFGADGVTPIRTEEVNAPGEAMGLPLSGALRDFQATLRGFAWRGHVIGLAEGEVVVEAEVKGSQSVKLPADISGRFYPARDVDYYGFSAKKGEIWQVEIVSHRLTGLTDPLVVVQKATTKDGKTSYTDVLVLNDADRNFGGESFNTFHHDDDGRLEIKEDGNYRIMVRDQFNAAVSDSRRMYRLIVRKPAPDFTLVARPVAHQANGDRRDVWTWNPVVRQGDVAALQLLLFRHDGFSGDIDLEVKGLPEGVSFSPSRISGSSRTATLLFHAGEGAKAWAGPVTIVARASVGARKLERRVRFAAINWSIDYNNSTTHLADVRLADRLVLGVCGESAPLELFAGDGKAIEAVSGGKVKVPVRVARRGGFKADLKVKPYGHSALGKIGDATIKGGAGEVVIDLKRFKLPVGTHTLHLKTNSKGKYQPTSPELIVARGDLAKATAAAKPAEDHAKALGEVLAIKTLSPGQKQAVQKEADEAAKTAKALVAKRESAAKRVKDLAAKLKPRDITAEFYSMPFVVKVNPQPKK